MTDDERCERYAAAIFGGPSYESAEAAMAVANEETADLRSTLKHAQVALRNAENETARLRTELDENTGIMQALRRQRDTAEATIARVEAELPDASERVKYGFPDEIALSNGLFGLADRVRAALEGEQS